MIRVAIIGLGAVTRNIHLPAYAQLRDRVKVVAGCDVEARARDWAAGRLPETYDDPQEMIRQTRPDVIAVCTPPALHHEQTIAALAQGCHVFCEKPLAMSLEQADEMIAAAEQANRLVMVNTQFPSMKIHQAAKRLIGAPEFGRLLFLQAWQTFRPGGANEAGWRNAMARRLCFEFGVHVFELIRFFFADNPRRILAHMPSPAPPHKAEVINLISMEFADGRAAAIMLNRLSRGPERYLEMRLDGEHASIHTSIGGEARFEIGLRTRERRPFFGLSFAPGGKAALQQGTRSKVIARDGINPFASATAVHFQRLIDALERGIEPPATARDNRQTLALTFAAYDSAQAGQALDTEPYLAIADWDSGIADL
jgi:predicted dehydrogenase